MTSTNKLLLTSEESWTNTTTLHQRPKKMAKLVGSRIDDAHDYAESIEELDDAQDKIETWEVVA